MGKPELAIPDLSLVLKLNPDHVNAAFARAACYNSMGLLTQAIEDYNFALFKDQTLNSPVREDSSNASGLASNTRNRTWSAASSAVLESPFSPKGSTKFDTSSIGFSPAASIVGSDGSSYQNNGSVPSSNGKRLDVDATGIFSLYGVASPTLGSNRYNNSRSMTPSSEQYHSDSTAAYGSESPRPGTSMSNVSLSSSSRNLPSSSTAASNTSTFKSLTQFRSSQQVQSSKEEDGTNNINANTAQADRHHAAAYELRKQGNYSAAIEEYALALRLDPRHFKSLFNRGFAYDKLGQFQQAIEDYSAAIEINPDYAFCFYNRGITYDHMGDLKAAISDFTRAVQLQPTNADFFHNRAFVYRKLQHWADAIDDYTTILRFSPQNFKALFNRSLCYERKDQLKEAMEDIAAALQLQPQHGGCYAHRALLFEKMEQFDKAVSDFTTALVNGAQTFPTLSSRARVYSKIGKNDLAISDLTTCLEMQPNDLPTLFSRATSFKSMQQFREAIVDFSRVLSLLQESSSTNSPIPGDASGNNAMILIAQQVLAFNQRGYCYRKVDQVEDAIRDYSQAIRLAPDQIRAYNNRGFLYAKCNRFEEAISDYTKAIQLDPQNAYAYHNRGISYDKLGQIDQAIADFGKVFELDSKQSLLANNGGNMNSMTTMMVPTTALKVPYNGHSNQQSNSHMSSGNSVDTSSGQHVFVDSSVPISRPNSALSMGGAQHAAAMHSNQHRVQQLDPASSYPQQQSSLPPAMVSPANNTTTNSGPVVVNGNNATANPLTKLSLRQQAQMRSRTPTSLSMPSASLVAPLPPPISQETSHENNTSSWNNANSNNSNNSYTNVPAVAAINPSPSILSRKSLGSSNNGNNTNNNVIESSATRPNLNFANTNSSNSSSSGNKVSFAPNLTSKLDAPSAPNSNSRPNIGAFNNNNNSNNTNAKYNSFENEDDNRSVVSAAAIDEKLDTVAALLSKFGGGGSNNSSSSSNNETKTAAPAAIRPSRFLVAQPTKVTATTNQEHEQSQVDDAGDVSPKPVSSGISAAQKFGVTLRSTTPNKTVPAVGNNNVESGNRVRPHFFRDPAPAQPAQNEDNNKVVTAEENYSSSADNTLPASIAAPLKAATFLAKLREGQQEEAKKLSQQQQQQQRLSASTGENYSLRPTFANTNKNSSNNNNNAIDTNDTVGNNNTSNTGVYSRPPGKFSQMYS